MKIEKGFKCDFCDKTTEAFKSGDGWFRTSTCTASEGAVVLESHFCGIECFASKIDVTGKKADEDYIREAVDAIKGAFVDNDCNCDCDCSVCCECNDKSSEGCNTTKESVDDSYDPEVTGEEDPFGPYSSDFGKKSEAEKKSEKADEKGPEQDPAFNIINEVFGDRAATGPVVHMTLPLVVLEGVLWKNLYSLVEVVGFERKDISFDSSEKPKTYKPSEKARLEVLFRSLLRKYASEKQFPMASWLSSPEVKEEAFCHVFFLRFLSEVVMFAKVYSDISAIQKRGIW